MKHVNMEIPFFLFPVAIFDTPDSHFSNKSKYLNIEHCTHVPLHPLYRSVYIQ